MAHEHLRHVHARGLPAVRFHRCVAAGDPALPPDPAHLGIDYPEELNRWLPLVKWFLAIPHYIALIILGIAGFFVWIYTAFAVLFTGKYPQGAFDFMVGIHRWATRVRAYTGLMRDEYPPFTLL